jgi:predicted amidohydrolase YtcJ
LTQGKIISADTQDKIYQAMAVRDGKIIALGKSKEMQAWKGSQTQVINLKGKVVIPGLIDSHMHAIRATTTSYSTEVHWFGLNSIKAALDKLKQAELGLSQESGSSLLGLDRRTIQRRQKTHTRRTKPGLHRTTRCMSNGCMNG